jgi:hypothetical protein
MSEVLGADPDALDRVSVSVDQVVRHLDGPTRKLNGAIHGSPWSGRNADLFRRKWDSEYRHSIRQASEFLKEASTDLRRNAQQQRDASAASGGALASSGNGSQKMSNESRSELEKLFKDNREIARPLGLKNVDGRQILKFEKKDGKFRIIEVVGDLSSAEQVLIHVPGMGTGLNDYRKGIHKHAQSMFSLARLAGEGNVAVVSFADYEIPDKLKSDTGLLEAASGHGADTGVEPLQGLVKNLKQWGYSSDQIGVVAHSYGSVVVGHTMKSGLDVGRVIVVGSPGVGADSRAELGSPNVEFHAGTSGSRSGGEAVGEAVGKAVGGAAGGGPGAAVGRFIGGAADSVVSHLTGGDGVSNLPGHGPDPTSSEFGAQRLDLKGGLDLNSPRGHSNYFHGLSGAKIVFAAILKPSGGK